MSVKKSYFITKKPKVLMIQINRVEFGGGAFGTTKNNQSFEIPEILDLGNFLVINEHADDYNSMFESEETVKTRKSTQSATNRRPAQARVPFEGNHQPRRIRQSWPLLLIRQNPGHLVLLQRQPGHRNGFPFCHEERSGRNGPPNPDQRVLPVLLQKWL